MARKSRPFSKIKRRRGVLKGLSDEKISLRKTLQLSPNLIKKDLKKAKPTPKGLTARTMLRYAKRASLRNADVVRIYPTKIARLRDKPGVLRFVAAKLPRNLRTGIIQPHVFWLRSLTPDKPYGKSKLQASCNCESDLMEYDYARDLHGACVRPKHNGEPPNIRNPNLWPGVCCHGVAILEWLLEVEATKPNYFATRPYWKAQDHSHL